MVLLITAGFLIIIQGINTYSSRHELKFKKDTNLKISKLPKLYSVGGTEKAYYVPISPGLLLRTLE